MPNSATLSSSTDTINITHSRESLTCFMLRVDRCSSRILASRYCSSLRFSSSFFFAWISGRFSQFLRVRAYISFLDTFARSPQIRRSMRSFDGSLLFLELVSGSFTVAAERLGWGVVRLGKLTVWLLSRGKSGMQASLGVLYSGQSSVFTKFQSLISYFAMLPFLVFSFSFSFSLFSLPMRFLKASARVSPSPSLLSLRGMSKRTEALWMTASEIAGIGFFLVSTVFYYGFPSISLSFASFLGCLGRLKLLSLCLGILGGSISVIWLLKLLLGLVDLSSLQLPLSSAFPSAASFCSASCLLWIDILLHSSEILGFLFWGLLMALNSLSSLPLNSWQRGASERCVSGLSVRSVQPWCASASLFLARLFSSILILISRSMRSLLRASTGVLRMLLMTMGVSFSCGKCEYWLLMLMASRSFRSLRSFSSMLSSRIITSRLSGSAPPALEHSLCLCRELVLMSSTSDSFIDFFPCLPCEESTAGVGAACDACEDVSKALLEGPLLLEGSCICSAGLGWASGACASRKEDSSRRCLSSAPLVTLLLASFLSSNSRFLASMSRSSCSRFGSRQASSTGFTLTYTACGLGSCGTSGISSSDSLQLALLSVSCSSRSVREERSIGYWSWGGQLERGSAWLRRIMRSKQLI